MGIMPLEDALRQAQERNLDLIQVTEKVEPPVCKIIDYGKYLYRQQKKEKGAKQKGGEMKGIRLSFNISQHDMAIRAKQAEKFLKEGDKIRIEMRLVGRQKALGDFAKEKVNKFLEVLQGVIPFKVEREIKREPRGFSMIVSKL